MKYYHENLVYDSDTGELRRLSGKLAGCVRKDTGCVAYAEKVGKPIINLWETYDNVHSNT